MLFLKALDLTGESTRRKTSETYVLIDPLKRDDTIPSSLNKGNGNVKVRSNLFDVFAVGQIGSVPMGVLMSTAHRLSPYAVSRGM